MNKEEILKAIDAILDGNTPHVDDGHYSNNGVPFLYVPNPYYDPETPGSFPALSIDFQVLKTLLKQTK